MWHGYYAGGWWMMGFGMLSLGIVIALVIWAITRSSVGNRHSDFGGSSDALLSLLKERYAKGEIDQDEYERVKKHLTEC